MSAVSSRKARIGAFRRSAQGWGSVIVRVLPKGAWRPLEPAPLLRSCRTFDSRRVLPPKLIRSSLDPVPCRDVSIKRVVRRYSYRPISKLRTRLHVQQSGAQGRARLRILSQGRLRRSRGPELPKPERDRPHCRSARRVLAYHLCAKHLEHPWSGTPDDCHPGQQSRPQVQWQNWDCR